jgi:hypothetical protein
MRKLFFELSVNKLCTNIFYDMVTLSESWGRGEAVGMG